MKILIIATIPPEREGRISRLIYTLLLKNELTIMSPKSSYQLEGAKFITIDEDIPTGYLDQLSYFFKTIKAYNKLKHREFDLIYICNYTSIPFGLYIWKKAKRLPIIYDAFELIIKTRLEKKTIRDLFYLWYESKVLKVCDAIISANKERALILQGYYQLNEMPYVISNMPINVESSKLYECLLNKCRENPDYITITYAGYISDTRKLRDLINEVVLLGDKYQLHIYGHGDYLQQLQDTVLENGYTNIQIYGKYNQRELKDILSKTDIGYLYYPNEGLNNIYCEPNKIYDYSMFCVPMISYYHPTLFDRLDNNNIGISNDNIREAIVTISNDIDEYKKNCFEFMMKQNSEDNVNLINGILKKVVNRT